MFCFLASFILCKPESHSNLSRSIHFTSSTTLDSLQGKWIGEIDSTYEVNIADRSWHQKYDNTYINSISESFQIYFSDTLVSESNFLNANINLGATSGNYIILVDTLDNYMDCIYLNGFYQDATDTTFSIRPAINWTMKSIQVFKKTQ